MSVRAGCVALALVGVGSAPVFGAEGTRPSVHGGGVIDVGYLGSSTRPANRTWRTKGTSWRLDRLEVNNAAAFIGKTATAESRWGFSAGVQGGRDVDNQVSDAAVGSADTQKHLYYTWIGYLFPVGGGLEVKGGLIPGNLGYEGFHAIDNATYTRAYGADLVAFFHWGLWATYAVKPSFSAALLVVNGYDYLARPNDVPSYGAQFVWEALADFTLTQNFYYGPEQSATPLEYWRFVSNTVAEWRAGEFLFAGSVGLGSEKQSAVIGTPRADWVWGALWARWQPREHWGFTVRPEFYRDPEGAVTGARQTLKAVTVGGEFRASPFDMNAVSARLEYRFDRSTGPDGGFYEGDSNALVPEQHLFMAALMWRFDKGG
jgi:hypothetical protein